MAEAPSPRTAERRIRGVCRQRPITARIMSRIDTSGID